MLYNEEERQCTRLWRRCVTFAVVLSGAMFALIGLICIMDVPNIAWRWRKIFIRASTIREEAEEQSSPYAVPHPFIEENHYVRVHFVANHHIVGMKANGHQKHKCTIGVVACRLLAMLIRLSHIARMSWHFGHFPLE